MYYSRLLLFVLFNCKYQYKWLEHVSEMTYGEVKPYSLTQVSITDPHCVTERQDHRGSDGGGGGERWEVYGGRR